MVNFKDPVVISRDFLVMVKLWHTLDGLYIWEFFTTLNYEWSIIRGNRPYRWTIWVYSYTRVSTLLTLIVHMISFNTSRRINCQLTITSEIIFANTATASASLLIVLRVIAVWNKNKIIYLISMSAWIANASCLIHDIVRLRGVWSTVLNVCMVPNAVDSKLNLMVSLCTDTVLLLIMIFGLFRLFSDHRGASSLGRLLWTQGLVWLLLATFAYTLPVIFFWLNLNVPFNLMFQTPALVILSTSATRMYSSLTDYRSHKISISIPIKNDLSASEANPTHVGPHPLNRMEVVVHTENEQYPSSQADNSDLYVITDGQLHDKLQELS
ncbi:hypothetical protein BC827DRAFT_546707 [Russula dissimulans]|nr:hypothetical protein BC827DRAFT_546707 [Russula dissimulans]